MTNILNEELSLKLREVAHELTEAKTNLLEAINVEITDSVSRVYEGSSLHRVVVLEQFYKALDKMWDEWEAGEIVDTVLVNRDLARCIDAMTGITVNTDKFELARQEAAGKMVRFLQWVQRRQEVAQS